MATRKQTASMTGRKAKGIERITRPGVKQPGTGATGPNYVGPRKGKPKPKLQGSQRATAKKPGSGFFRRGK